MTPNRLAAGLLCAVLTFLLPGMGGANAQQACRVQIITTGTYQASYTGENTPIPMVLYRNSSGPRSEVTRTGNSNLCNRTPLNSAINTRLYDPRTPVIVPPHNADARMYQILNGIVQHVLVDGAASRDRISYNDYGTIAQRARNNVLGEGINDLLVETGKQLAERFFPQLSFFRNRRFTEEALKRSAEFLIDTFLKGDSMEAAIEGQAQQIVRDAVAQGLFGDLDDGATQVIFNEIRLGLGLMAKQIQAELADVKPQSQSIQAYTAAGAADTNDCSWDLYVLWNPRTGAYSSRFTKACGDQNAVAGMTVSGAPEKPGANGQLTIGATRVGGGPIQILSVTVDGLDAVMPNGGNYAVAGVPGGAPTVTFPINKPRRHGPFPLKITITVRGADGAPLTFWRNYDYSVLNVPPEITALPGKASAEPDENLVWSGKLMVTDDNADKMNAGEVTWSRLNLSGHPAGLDTLNKSGRLTRRNLDSHDGDTGEYVFDVEWDKKKVDYPHPHEEFDVTLSVADSKGETASQDFTLEVEDVLPDVKPIVEPRQFFHSKDGEKVNIRLVIRDPNGWRDIVNARVDATKAGGQVYDTADGSLVETSHGDDVLRLKIREPFGHTDVEGRHDIPVHAEDGDPAPNDVDTGTFISIGNEKPFINITGYIYEVPTPLDRLCPGQPFKIGTTAGDPEEDKIRVWATIVETGQKVELIIAAGEKTWTGTMNAPGVPGDYTLRYDAQETDTVTKKSADPKTLKLTVVPCEKQLDDYTYQVLVSPQEICPGEPFTVEPTADLFFTDKTSIRGAHPEATVTYGGQSAATGEANPKATFTAQDPPGVQPIAVTMRIGDLDVPVNAAVTVKPCGAVEEKKEYICLDPRAHEAINVGSNAEVGSTALTTKKIKETVGGGLGSVLGGGSRSGGFGLGGGGQRGIGSPPPSSSQAKGPQTRDDPVPAAAMQRFTDAATGITLAIGATETDKGLVVSTYVEESPDDGTFQTVFMEDACGARAGPIDFLIYEIYRDWKLTVWFTYDRWVDGEHVEHREGGWSEGGREMLGTWAVPAGGDGIWNQLGFEIAVKGIQGLGSVFPVSGADLAATGDMPMVTAVHVTRPDRDPVDTKPFLFETKFEEGQVTFWPVDETMASKHCP